MELPSVLDKFYLSFLDYLGLEYKDGEICNKDEKLGEVTIDDKKLTLPYFSNLKNPNNRLIIHPLNEDFLHPEDYVFKFLKKRLVFEINIKLTHLIIDLITVASDVNMQQKIKNKDLIDIIVNIGEADISIIESFLAIIKASKKQNEEKFILDLFLKKNGSIDETPYAAVSKIVYILPNEVDEALINKEKEYKVFGSKVRKKDLLVLTNIFNVVFPDFKTKEYIVGSDNKVFRMLNVLLTSSYLVTNRINEICDMLDELKEPTLNVEDIRFNLDWTNLLPEVYEATNEIRLIPNQTDTKTEIKTLKVDESKVAHENSQSFNPSSVPQPQPNQFIGQAPSQQVLAPPKPMSPEDIIKNSMNMPAGVYQQPVMPQYQQPRQEYVPNWVMQEQYKNQNPNMARPPMYQQPVYQQPMPGQPMFPQPMGQQPMYQQPMFPQPMGQPMPGYPMQQYPNPMQPTGQPEYSQGLQLNPYIMSGNYTGIK